MKKAQGAALRILGAEAMSLAYPILSAGTTVLVDGPNAVFDTLGYAFFYGDRVAVEWGVESGRPLHDG